LVFETLGQSLYQVLEKNDYHGYPIEVIQDIAYQVLKWLKNLKEKTRLIHTDLKPENILFQTNRMNEVYNTKSLPIQTIRSLEKQARDDRIEWRKFRRKENDKLRKNPYSLPDHNGIKLIDFGSATYEEETHSGTINTRQYRGPEVILNWMDWDDKSDILSLGCILAELYTGNQLFPTHSSIEHIAFIE
jgi:dual-specificity kinase